MLITLPQVGYIYCLSRIDTQTIKIFISNIYLLLYAMTQNVDFCFLVYWTKVTRSYSIIYLKLFDQPLPTAGWHSDGLIYKPIFQKFFISHYSGFIYFNCAFLSVPSRAPLATKFKVDLFKEYFSSVYNIRCLANSNYPYTHTHVRKHKNEKICTSSRLPTR